MQGHNTTRKEDLAWAAGFMDGEAHFGLATTNKRTNNKHLHIQVCQTQDGPLQRLQQILGVGTIYGPYTQNSQYPNRRPYKQYHISKFSEVQKVVGLLWPWLSEPKKQQAKIALDAYTEYKNRIPLKKGPKPKPKPIPFCHPDKPFKAKGMCNTCYRRALKLRRINVQ